VKEEEANTLVTKIKIMETIEQEKASEVEKIQSELGVKHK
jgi:hypothetical protein